MVPETAVTLWIDYLPFRRYQISVLGDILLDLGLPSGISHFLKSLQTHRRVRNTLLEQFVEHSCKTAENRYFSVLASPPVRQRLEVITVQSAKPGSCDTGTPLKLCQVDLIS